MLLAAVMRYFAQVSEMSSNVNNANGTVKEKLRKRKSFTLDANFFLHVEFMMI